MQDNKNEEKEVVTSTTEEKNPDPSKESPLKNELEKVQRKGTNHTKLEKAIFSRKKIDEEIENIKKEEGIEEEPLAEDENAPVTVGMLRRIEQEKAQKTALGIAEDISDDTERELTQYHLKYTIKPSGNPSQDVKNARAIVNIAKNTQILEETERKATPKRFNSGSGAPAKKSDSEFVPTREEAEIMRAFPAVTKEKVIATRKNSQQ